MRLLNGVSRSKLVLLAIILLSIAGVVVSFIFGTTTQGIGAIVIAFLAIMYPIVKVVAAGKESNKLSKIKMISANSMTELEAKVTLELSRLDGEVLKVNFSEDQRKKLAIIIYC